MLKFKLNNKKLSNNQFFLNFNNINKKINKNTKMIHYKKKYNHLIKANLYNNVIIPNVDPSIIPYNIYIVYYINTFTNTNYFEWLVNQINIVIKMNAIQIYIMATISKENEILFRQKVLAIFPNVIIECNYTNLYEYPGILKVWELGQLYSNSNDIVLYFHSKGVTHHTSYKYNMNDSYNVILKNIDKIKEIYTIFPYIDKIGYSVSKWGWIWYNFWYARLSYINKVEKPIITTRRHYYEDWLHKKVKEGFEQIVNNERPVMDVCYDRNVYNCYGFYRSVNTGNIGFYYDNMDDTYNPI